MRQSRDYSERVGLEDAKLGGGGELRRLFLGDGFDLHLLYNAINLLSIVLQAFCVSDPIP